MRLDNLNSHKKQSEHRHCTVCTVVSIAMRSVLLLLAMLCAGAARADRYHPADPAGRAAAANRAETDATFWTGEAQAAITARLAQEESVKKARNVVMFLGDGMSVPTLAAARTLLGQRRGATGEEAKMYFENFPTIGMVKVNYSLSLSEGRMY